MTDHYLIRHPYPGSYGDRPEPGQTVFTCSCGEELLFFEEGLSDPIMTPEEALEEHLDGIP